MKDGIHLPPLNDARPVRVSRRTDRHRACHRCALLMLSVLVIPAWLGCAVRGDDSGETVASASSAMEPAAPPARGGIALLPADADVAWPGDDRISLSTDAAVVRMLLSLYPSLYREVEFGDAPSAGLQFPLLKIHWLLMDMEPIDKHGYSLVVEAAVPGEASLRRMVVVGSSHQAGFEVIASAPYSAADGIPREWEHRAIVWGRGKTPDEVMDMAFTSTCAAPVPGTPGVFEMLVDRADGTHMIRFRLDLSRPMPVELLEARQISVRGL